MATLIGTTGNDLLEGVQLSLFNPNGQNYQISGLAGNDTIQGNNYGNDVLDGGEGIDTLSYSKAIGDISVSLAISMFQSTGGGGLDTITNFENLIGGDFNDSLFGNALDNVIMGGAGNDSIFGGDGNDTIDGGAGNDTLLGGNDTDSLSYASATAGITFSLAITSAQATGGAGTDTATGFENLIGGDFNDSLSGSAAANLIMGGDGDDTIVGAAGNDTLDGGLGNDTLTYASAGAGITLNLTTLTAQVTGGAGTHTVTGIENLIGSDFDDSLTGGSTGNVISGGLGNDTIDGGAGNDTLDGGPGTDTLSYGSARAAITVSLAINGAQVTGGSGTDTVTGFDNLIGSNFNDNLTGDANANAIAGGSGNDTITGGLGNDSIDGGSATDTAAFSGLQSSYRFGTRDGIVMLIGVDGTDQLTSVELLKFGAAAAVSVASLQGTSADQGLIFGNIGGNNSYILPDVYVGPVAGLQNQQLGSAVSDSVLGTENADFINALAGDDAVNGGGGNDVIDGGLGSNFLSGGAGTDSFFVDGRGAASFNTWSTITDFDVAAGESVSIFGYKPGVSQYVFVENDGTAGFKGITMHWDLDGNGLIDTSVTLSGLSEANLHTPLFGADYIYIY